MNKANVGLINWLNIKRPGSSTPPLGERELAVLDVLWQSPGLSAQAIHQQLLASTIGLNTVQSTIERLHRKQLLSREKHGRQYLYTPLKSKEEIISSLLHDIANELAGGDMAPMISGFLRFLGREDARDTAAKLPTFATQLASNSEPSE